LSRVSNELAGTLSRIYPTRDAVACTVRTGNRPEGLAVAGEAVYVAVRTSGLAHRGGTLTAVTAHAGIDTSIDPAVAYGGQYLIPTNDGLLAYRRVAGSDGLRLVADLATSVPTPTNGDMTYTFQLRPGIRYSTGSLVRPADFRRAIERALVNPAGPNRIFFTGIVGGEACVKTPKECDLREGIVADPAANTVTFHLTAPDRTCSTSWRYPPRSQSPRIRRCSSRDFLSPRRGSRDAPTASRARLRL
jgi:ABC-type transport system substrate-binding protein